jgi:hypothetical protein
MSMSTSSPNRQRILKALTSLVEAFNAHDLDRIMSHFTEDAVLELPRGQDPGGALCREGRCARRAGRTIQGDAGCPLRRGNALRLR